jgi:ABC-type cobalamin transport system ATPase subunit
VQVRIETASGGEWQLVRTATAWQLRPARPEAVPAAEVVLAPEVAWQLFTKGLSLAQARARVRITGDAALAEAALRLVAVMA